MTDGKRREVTATRAVLRELRAEDLVAHEGREFLDQKRMLLATEILRRMRELDRVRAELREGRQRADAALAKAIARHGLEGALAYPSEPVDVELRVQRTRFIGVELVEVDPEVPEADGGMGVRPGDDLFHPPAQSPPPLPSGRAPNPLGSSRALGAGLAGARGGGLGGGVSAVQPSPEARLCGWAFRELLGPTARLAALSSTLMRLGEEYRQTDRRVRALERVLMPEIEATLRSVSEELDEQDQDEAIYARLPRTRKT